MAKPVAVSEPIDPPIPKSTSPVMQETHVPVDSATSEADVGEAALSIAQEANSETPTVECGDTSDSVLGAEEGTTTTQDAKSVELVEGGDVTPSDNGSKTSEAVERKPLLLCPSRSPITGGERNTLFSTTPTELTQDNAKEFFQYDYTPIRFKNGHSRGETSSMRRRFRSTLITMIPMPQRNGTIHRSGSHLKKSHVD